MLLAAGFNYPSNKGSHTVWSHSLLPYSLVISGENGAVAARYEKKRCKKALKDL